jgi:hypothetical protein
MRIQFGGPTAAVNPAGGKSAGRRIRQPGRWTSAVLAALAGVILLCIPIIFLFNWNGLAPMGNRIRSAKFHGRAGGRVPALCETKGNEADGSTSRERYFVVQSRTDIL